MENNVASQASNSICPEGYLDAPEDILILKRLEGNMSNITHLPEEILVAILCRMSDPKDVAAAFMASRAFWGIANATPFRLVLRRAWFTEDVSKTWIWTRRVLSGLRRSMSTTQELDLAGCPILDDDVAAILADLSSLDTLILDGCQKLTSSIADELIRSLRPGPRTVSLQRCFSLGSASAAKLLMAAAGGTFRLQTLLLSHLDRLELPLDPATLDTSVEKRVAMYAEIPSGIVSKVTSQGLRILALHNCDNLGVSALMAVEAVVRYGICNGYKCHVFRAGSELSVFRGFDVRGSTNGLGLSQFGSLHSERAVLATSALVETVKLLQYLYILELTFFTPVVSAVRAQVGRGIHIWDFCDEESVTAAADVVAHLTTSPFPYFGSGNCTAHGHGSTSLESFSFLSMDTSRFSFRGSSQRNGTSNATRRIGSVDVETKWGLHLNDTLLAVKAGTNCSNSSRKTPVHVFAARGDVDVVRKLLFLGASPARMKDSGGATALFLAAENGHADVCALLLDRGSDVLLSNRAGETPLYISALRGHSTAVEVILSYCWKHGIDWQDAQVYGDGWTPLMAATVAGRQNVAEMLLQSAYEPETDLSSHGLEHVVSSVSELFSDCAGASSSSQPVCQESCSEKIFAPRFVDAQNRYGQTALHIAALKASSWFVDYLLRAGASVDVKDEFGSRPIDIARKHQHSVIQMKLKEWQEMLTCSEGVNISHQRQGKVGQKKQKKVLWMEKK